MRMEKWKKRYAIHDEFNVESWISFVGAIVGIVVIVAVALLVG